MTTQQARDLQQAIIEQTEARTRLGSASNADAIVHWATRYIDATDRCYEIATEIKGRAA